MPRFGSLLKRLRLRRDWTVADLARESGVAQSHISNAAGSEMCTWKPATKDRVVSALERRLPFTQEEIDAASDIGLMTEAISSRLKPANRMPWSPPINSTSSVEDEAARSAWYNAIVARVGAEKAPAVAKMIDAMISLMESRDGDPSTGDSTGIAEVSTPQSDRPKPPRGAVRADHANGVTEYAPVKPAKPSPAPATRSRRA